MYLCSGCFEFEADQIPCKCENCGRVMKFPLTMVSGKYIIMGNILYHLNKRIYQILKQKEDERVQNILRLSNNG